LKKRLTFILLLAWLVLSVVFYILVNHISYLQGFSLQSATASMMLNHISIFLNIGSVLQALTGIFIFSTACLITGLGLRRGIGLQEDRLLQALTAFLTGEILFSIFFLLLADKTIFTPCWLKSILIAGILSGLQPAWRFLKKTHLQVKIIQEETILWVLIISIVSISLLTTSARLGYDAAAEYFSGAKIIAQTGQHILLYPSDKFFVSSLHPGILFTAVIQLFGDQAARMLSWVNGLLILTGGWALGKKAGLSEQARLYFLILMLTSTAFVDLLGDGKIELISTAPIIIALYWMLESRQNPSRYQFLLIGVLLGFAIISRPYNNIFLVTVFSLLFYVSWMVENIRALGWSKGIHATVPVLWILPPLLTLGIFHLWQNWLWLGSPLAPLTYAQSLDSGDWQWQFDPDILNTLRLLYPLTVTFFNSPQSLGTISPLFVGFLPFLAFSKIRSRLTLSKELISILLPAFITLILWLILFFTVVEIRYVFFLWVIFFLVGAKIMEAALQALPKPENLAAQALIAGLLLFISIRTLVISIATYSPIDSSGQAHCYDLDFCTFLEPLNQSAPPGARVLALHAYRYYLRPDLFSCSSQAHEYEPLQDLAQTNPSGFWEEAYRQGYLYLTYEYNFAVVHSHFGKIPAPEQAPDWLQVEIISDSHSGEKVYRLSATNAPFLPEKQCLQEKDGIWRVQTASP